MKELIEKALPVLGWLGLEVEFYDNQGPAFNIRKGADGVLHSKWPEPQNAEALSVICEALLKKEQELFNLLQESPNDRRYVLPRAQIQTLIEMPWRRVTAQNVLKMLSEIEVKAERA